MSLSKTKSLLKIGQAAKALGVSIDTLRRWEKAGKIEATRTPGGTRLYSLSSLKKINPQVVSDFEAKSLTTEELLKRVQKDSEGLGEPEYQSIRESDISEILTHQPTEFSEPQKTASFVNKFLIGTGILSAVTLVMTSWIAASYLTQPKATQEFFKNNIASGLLSPFHKLAEESVAVISPKKAQELGFIPQYIEPPPASSLQSLASNPNVLAVTSTTPFLEVNAPTQINGNLFVRDQINNLSLEGTPSASTVTLSSGATTLTVTNTSTIDQNLAKIASPTFNTLNLSATKDQLVFQSGGPSGTLTWTPTAARTITLPDATTTLVGKDTTDTLKNKSISGSDNTLTAIPNSALSNNKVTVTAGTNLTGGGDVALGSSVTISLKSSPAVSGVFSLADGTAAAPSLTFTDDTDTGLYRIGSNKIGLITGGTATSGITIDSSGNVGVGNITPSATLYVSGNVGIGYTGTSSAAPGLGLAVAGSVGIGTTSPAAPFHVWGNGTNSAFFLNGNVGIGATSPSYTLDVWGDTRVTGSITGGTTVSIADGSAGTPALNFTNDTDTGLWRIGANQVALTTGGGSHLGLAINSSGNVGIGNTSASQIFQVNSGSSSTVITSSGNIGIGTTTANSNLSIAGNAHIGSLYQATAAPTNGLFVDGNVGIGATTSSNKLDVWGNSRIAGTLTVDSTLTGSSVFRAANGSASAPAYSFTNLTNAGLWTNGNGLLLTTGGSNTSGITVTAAGSVGIGTTAPNATLSIQGNVGIGYTGANQAIPSNGLAVSGNVGIGTTSPAANLHVVGTAQFNGNSTFYGNLLAGADISYDIGSAAIRYNNLYVYTITATNIAGTVTSGSTSSSDWLINSTNTSDTSNSTLSFKRGSPTNAVLQWYGSNNTFDFNSGARLGYNNGSASTIESTTGLVLAGFANDITTGTNEHLALIPNGTGNVGIGTSSPGALLGVLGGVNIGGGTSRFAEKAGPANGLAVEGNVGIGTTTANSNLSVAGNAHIGSLYQGTAAPTNGLFVDGNVGIGATTSSNKLDVWGNSRLAGTLTVDSNSTIGGTLGVTGAATFSSTGSFSSTLSISDGTAGTPGLNFSNDTNTGLWRIGADQLALTTGGGAMKGLAIDSNGNVGIGTTGPLVKLDVEGATLVGAGNNLILGRTGNDYGHRLYMDATNDFHWVTNVAAVNFGNTTGGTEAVFIKNNGNVGIGTTSPSQIFQVNTGSSSTVITSTGNVGIGTTTANSSLSVSGNAHIGSLYQGTVAPTNGLLVDGNVGIGATTSSNKLDVWGNSRLAGTLTVDSNSTIGGTLGVTGALTLSANNAALSFTGTTPSLTSGSSVFGIFAGGNVGIGTTGNLYGGLTVRGAGTGTNITLQTYGSGLGQGLSVLDNGNVGIGITNPARLLQMHSTGADTRLRISTGSSTGFEAFEFYDNTSTFRGIIGYENTASRDRMEFYTSGDTAVPRMIIQGAGNIGIGTTSPLSLLSVSGNAHIGGIRQGISAPTNGLFVDGNVGIGATTSSNLLDVWGNSRLAGTLTVDQAATFSSTGSFSGALTLSTNNGALSFTGTTPSLTSGSSVFGLFAGGNVGIGTTGNVYGGLTVRGAGTGTNITLQTYGSGLGQGLSVLDNGNVGIGTTSPFGKLQVVGGNVGIGTFSDPAGGPYSPLEIRGAAGASGFTTAKQFNAMKLGLNSGVEYGGQAQLWIGRYEENSSNARTALTISLAHGGIAPNSDADTDIMTLLSSGNVGIGFTTPTANLHVLNTAAQDSFRVDDVANDTTPFIIDQAGNVGVGATTAAYNLDVWGTARVTGAATFASTGIFASTLTTSNGFTLTTGALSLTSTSGAVNLALTPATNALTVGGDLGVDLTNHRVGIGTTAPTVALQVLGGNVGIGTSAAGAALQVNGGGLFGWGTASTSLSSGAIAGFNGNVGVGTTTANSTLSVAGNAHIGGIRQGISAPSNGLFVDGNVGIGATTSNNLLDVWGNSRLAGTLTVDQAATFSSTGSFSSTLSLSDGTAATPGLNFNNDTNTGLWRIGADQIALTTGGSAFKGLSVNSNGNVGVGITSASALLEINTNNSGNGGWKIAAAGGGYTSTLAVTGVTSNNRSGEIQEVLSDNSPFGWTWSATGTGGAGTFLILKADSGNVGVGIGGNSPSAKLHLAGSGTTTGLSFLSTGSGGGGGLVGIQDSGNVGIGNTSPVQIFQVNTGSSSTVITSTGNVGIGTTTANSNLSVAGSAHIGALYQGTAAPTNGLFVDGNVGIGATTSSNKLDVWGNSRLAGTLTVDSTSTIGGTLGVTGASTLTGALQVYNNIDAGDATHGGYVQAWNGGGAAYNVKMSFPSGNVALISTGSLGLELAPSNSFVGINNNNPGVALDVTGAGKFSSTLSLANGTATTPALNFTNSTGSGLWYNNVTNQISLTTAGLPFNGININSSGNVGIGATNVGGSLVVASGNVGIGFTSPSDVLQVMTGSGTNRGITISTTGTSQTGGATLSLDTTSDSGRIWRIISNDPANAGGAGALSIFDNTANANRITIDTNGNVGIGTTSPTATLSVGPLGGSPTFTVAGATGNTSISGTLGVSGVTTLSANNAALSFTGTTPSLTSGSSVFGLFAGGNVGIGTTGNLYGGLTVRGAGTGTNITLQTYGSGLGQGLSVLDNGNVGVGTTAPGFRLDVLNDIRVNGTTNAYFRADRSATTTDAAVAFSTATSSDWAIGTLGATIGTGSDFNFYDAAGTVGSRMTIKSSSGNVGIGTTGPSKLLEVQKNQNSETGLNVANTTSGTGAYSISRLQTDSSQFLNTLILSTGYTTSGLFQGTRAFVDADTAGGLWLGSRNASGIVGFFTGGTALTNERMRITSTGNVGIGTSSPLSLLSIAGNAHIGSLYQGTVAPTNGLFVDGNVGIGATTSSNKLDVWGNSRLAGTLTVDSNSTIGGTLGVTGALTLSANNAALSFTGTTPSLTSGGSVFGLFAGGNVGIGTTGNLYGGLTVRGAGTGTGITFQTYGSGLGQGLTVLDNGNVGIGTTAPTANLHINVAAGSNALFRMSDGDVTHGATTILPTDTYLEIQPSASTGGGAYFTAITDSDSNNPFYFRGIVTNEGSTPIFNIDGAKVSGTGKAALTGTSNVFGISNNGGSNVFVVNAGGNVGIGATTSSSKLDVWGNSRLAGTLTVDSNSTIGGTLGVTGALTLSANNAALSFTGTTPSLTSGGSVFGLFAGGNVGIGTTGNLYGGLTVRGAGTGTGITFQTYGSGLGQGLTVLDNGNVGIGTTAPSNPLSVTREGVDQLGATPRTVGYFGGNTTNKGIHIGYDSNEVLGIISSQAASSGIAFWSHNGSAWGERMRIHTNGNVGIGGDTTPDALFAVGSTSQFQVNSSGAIAAVTGITTSGGYTQTGSSANTLSGALTLSANNAALSFTGSTPSLTSGSSVFGLFAGGNVGIGTTGNLYGGLTVRGAGTGTGITFQTYGSGLGQGLSVLDNGNVGVGTTSSSNPLHIVQNNPTNALLGLYNNVNSGNGWIDFYDFSGNRLANITRFSGGNGMRIQSVYGTSTPIQIASSGTSAGGDIIFQAGTTDIVRFLANGNVGIGFTSPDRLTQIASDINIVGSNASLLGAAGTQFGITGSSGTGTSKKLVLGIDTTDNYGVIQAGNTSGTNYDLSLNPAGGNVGIGNTSPLKLLHVGAGGDTPAITADGMTVQNNGVTAITVRDATNDVEQAMWVGGESGGAAPFTGRLGTTSNHILNITTNNATRMTIDTGGNVGIGFTSPDRLTQIASDINIVGSNASLLGAAGTQFGITGSSGTGTSKKLVLGIDTTDNYGVIQAGNTSGTNYNLILNPAGGNVGIGTTSPGATLEVNGAMLVGGNITVKRTTVGTYTAVDCGAAQTNASTVYIQTTDSISANMTLYNTTRGVHARISVVTSSGGCTNGKQLDLASSITGQVAGDSVTIYSGVSNLGDSTSGYFDTAYIVKGLFATATTSQGFDIAEQYPTQDPSIESADVVAIDSQNKENIVKSARPYDKTVIGIISTTPGITLGDGQIGIWKKVALAGRVPVKVSTENGPIQAGDYLTSSSTPGVAMKAIRPGQVVGKALEIYDNPDPHQWGKILAFINISFADPGNFLASLSLDSQGNLIIPKIRAASIILDSSIASASAQLSMDTTNIQPSYFNLAEKFATQSAQIANLDLQVATASSSIASQSAQLASASAELANIKSKVDSLKLTPPDILLASGSATLASLTVSEATVSAMLTAYSAQIQDHFKVLGQTTLSKTNVVGDLTVDGTLSLENGSELNVIGTLFLQKSLLAQKVDIFNGKVIIDSSGNITSLGKVIAPELKTNKLTISNTPIASGSASLAASIGTRTIPANQTTVTILTADINNSSKVFITPTTSTDRVLSVTNIKNRESFDVSILTPALIDINFNWWIVQTE